LCVCALTHRLTGKNVSNDEIRVSGAPWGKAKKRMIARAGCRTSVVMVVVVVKRAIEREREREKTTKTTVIRLFGG
jgi:hypothetical protein